MKYITTFLALVFSLNSYADFLHPMDYTGTSVQDKQLKEYISQQVQKEQCSMGKEKCESKMEATTKLELEAFLKLTKKADREKLDGQVEVWCMGSEEPCYYGIISMMYDN